MVQITDLSPGENDDASSRDGERLRLAGNAFFATGDYTSAAKAYASSLAAAPPPSGSAAAALGNRVVALIKLGRLREALADAERCVTVCPPGSPYAAKARFRKGEALEAIGDLRGAREAYRDANGEAPSDTSVLAKLKSTSEALTKSNPSSESPVMQSPKSTSTPQSTPGIETPPRTTSTSSPSPSTCETETLWKKGNDHLRSARYEDALIAYETYEKALRETALHEKMSSRLLSSERQGKLLGNKALAFSKLGRHDAAVVAARAANHGNKNCLKLINRLGNVAITGAEAVVASLEHEEKQDTGKKENKAQGEDRTSASRRKANAWAVEARTAFQLGFETNPSPEDAEVLRNGRDRCQKFLDDWVFVEHEEKAKTVTKETPGEKEETPKVTSIELTSAASVSVLSLSKYAKRAAASHGKKISPETEEDKALDREIRTFRDSMAKFGCAVVTLPDLLFAEYDVFANATDALVTFFAKPGVEKNGFKPLSKQYPHGYFRAGGGEECSYGQNASSTSRRDEQRLERFSVCQSFDSDFVWPTGGFDAAAQNTHAVLAKVAKVCGDVCLLGRPGKGDTKAYDSLVTKLSKSPHAQRTTFALQQRAGRKTRGENDGTEAEEDAEKATLTFLSKSLESVAKTWEPEPTLLTLVPRVLEDSVDTGDRETKKSYSSDQNKTPTATVTVRCGATETVFSSEVGKNKKNEKKNAGAESPNPERDVLVVAGIFLQELMGGAFEPTTASFEASAGDRACVRVTHRA